jgi:glycosyltransferase involved in cell wall biosynthesis
MKVSVLVPFGADDSAAGKQRAKVWRYNLRRWDALRTQGIISEVILGIDCLFGASADHVEVFNRNFNTTFSVSRALNDAAAHARGDVFLMFGADHVPDPAVIRWATEEIKRHPWVRLHDLVLYATEAATHLIVDGPFGSNLFQDAANWHRHPAPCPGVLALTRAAWTAAGGMDERFAGWGYEDTEFLSRLRHLVPGGAMGPSGLPLRELFVPATRDLRGENLNLFSKITTERGW